MRAYELLIENSEEFSSAGELGLTGTNVYHGTSSANLTKIMRNGLSPRPNKWIHNNRYQGSITNFKPGERKEVAELSTTTDLKQAKHYAAQGGSTGWGDKTGGIVVGFKILENDIVRDIGYDINEIVFKNKISPDRLKIVFPDRLVGKENKYINKAEDFRANSVRKTARIKEINKALKNAGSTSLIRSLNANTPRVRIMGPDNILNNQNLDLDTPAFKTWLQQELQKPATEDDVRTYSV